MQPPIQHFFLTRSAYNPQRDVVVRGQSMRPDFRYYQRRFELFRDICCASLSGQTRQDFAWIVLLCANDPMISEKLSVLSKLPFPVHTPMGLPKPCQKHEDEVSHSRWWTMVKSVAHPSRPVLTTRIDDDDAVAFDFVERLRSKAGGAVSQSLIFPSGHVIQSSGVSKSSHPGNQFCSLLSPAGVRQTVMDVKHNEISNLSDHHVVVDSRPAWMWSRHGGSKSRGGRFRINVQTKDIMHLYRVNWGALSLEYKDASGDPGNPLRLRSMPKQTLAGKDVAGALRHAAGVLSKHRADFWISGGTLLGLHRDGSFIPHDDDIDIEVMGNSVVPYLGEMGVPLFIRKDGEFTSQIVFELPQGVRLDLIFWRPDGTDLVAKTTKELRYPMELWSDRAVIEFDGTDYPCLNPDAYCEYVYGPDWMIPKDEKGAWTGQKQISTV